MDWRYNTIWFDQINEDNQLMHDFKETRSLPDKFSNVEYASISHLKRKGNSFGSLTSSNQLLYLNLDWANIVDFSGIDKFSNLKRMELHYCTKLESDSGISNLKQSIRYLHINQSKKFKFADELLQLDELVVLCLNSCGPIDNLRFLKRFPKLVDFRFVNTDILDGDLKPILEHPTIRCVGFLNKRHYNYSDSEIEMALRSKGDQDFKEIVYKGDYSTYKYSY